MEGGQGKNHILIVKIRLLNEYSKSVPERIVKDSAGIKRFSTIYRQRDFSSP